MSKAVRKEEVRGFNRWIGKESLEMSLLVGHASLRAA
jgi:hypothetical protein